MLPRAQLSMLECGSRILPFIRTPVRACLSVVRPLPLSIHRGPYGAHRPAQDRSLHLYKTARASTLLGQHKILYFQDYTVEPPSNSQHKVNLVASDSNPTPIATDLSLQELYDNHVKPGHMLYLTQPITKQLAENLVKLQEENIADKERNYAIVKPGDCVRPGTKDFKTFPQHGKQLGPLKNMIFRLSSPPSYVKIILDKAYQFIAAGSPVEFRIRFKGSTSKKEKLEAGPSHTWPWMHAHWPHLRPDFILKSMPEGSTYLIQPVSDGYCVQFVISMTAAKMPTANLQRRLWKIKSGVKQAMDMGKLSQLPKIVRERLRELGNKEYSIHSGLPKSQALAGYTDDKSVAKWGFNEGERPVELSKIDKENIQQNTSVHTLRIPDGDTWIPKRYVARYKADFEAIKAAPERGLKQMDDDRPRSDSELPSHLARRIVSEKREISKDRSGGRQRWQKRGNQRG